MLLCMQLYNFRHLRQLSEPLSDYLKNESVINYVKVCYYYRFNFEIGSVVKVARKSQEAMHVYTYIVAASC